MGYIAKSYTAGSDSVEVALAPDIGDAYDSITISNDDDTDQVNIKLNDESNDAIPVKAGESITVYTKVFKLFYQAAAGTPAFRVVCDGRN